MAKYGAGNILENEFTVYVHSFTDPNDSRYIHLLLNDVLKLGCTIKVWNDYWKGQYTFTELEPCTDYTVDFYIGTSHEYQNNDWQETLYVTTAGCGDTPPPGRPPYFYWISRNTNLKRGMAIADYITAEKWMDLKDNIDDVRDFVGYSEWEWDQYRWSPGDIITAAEYNDVASSMNSLVSAEYKIPKVNAGDPITARCMMALQYAVNSLNEEV